MTDRDWTVAPGETLREWREEQRLSAETAAILCWMEDERYERIEAGEEPITVRDAVTLAIGTGISANLWLMLERAYRDDLAAGRSRKRS